MITAEPLAESKPTALLHDVASEVSDAFNTKSVHHDLARESKELKIGLVGFGRTGRDVAKLLLTEPTVSLEWIARRSSDPGRTAAHDYIDVTPSAQGSIYSVAKKTCRDLLEESPVDVIIDFSSESGINFYGKAAADLSVSIVSAVSRYSEAKQRQLKDLARRTQVLWSPNITLGINFMLLAAQTLRRIAPGVDIQIVEEHFRDKPETSGTALRLARALEVPDSAVHVIRAGGIIGVHEVLFGFPAQTVRLRHEAISRQAFGNGAIFAAYQVVDRPPGFYRMEDILLPFFAGEGGHAIRDESAGGLRGRLAGQLRSLATRLDSREAP